MSDWMDAEAHADRALEMFERGRWAEAEEELRKALALNPDQAEWHFNLGLTVEQAGRDNDALTCYEKAIELMPDQVDPLLAGGVVANRLGQFERAIKWLEKAITLAPTLEEPYAHKMESHIRSGHHDEAETTFYMAQHALDEPSAQVLSVMAESLIQRGSFDRAEWCLREAMRLEPTMSRVRARLAAVFGATGRPQRAVQLYLRELRDDPGNIDTLLEFGSLLYDLGRIPEAAEKFRRVLELEPANPDAHFRLGLIALAANRFEQASMEFELVLKLDGEFPGIRCAIGETLLRRREIDEARRYLLEEFAAAKASAESRFTDPIVISQGPIDRTEMALHVQLSNAALSQLAGLLLEVHEPARAAELLEIAVNEEETVELLRLLALARFRAGNRDGGAAASRRVLRKEPTCIRSIHNLALAALEQRRPAIAAGWIKRGLTIDANDNELRRLRMRLWLVAGRSLLDHWCHRMFKAVKATLFSRRLGQ